MRRGDAAGLKRTADEIVAIHERLGDPVALANARLLAGIICWIGRWDDPDRLLRGALALTRRADARHVAAAAEHASGILAVERAEPALARERFDCVARELAQLQNVAHAFVPALTPGFALERDARGRARLTFQETMILGHRLGAAQATALLPSSAAWAWRVEGDLETALALASDSTQRTRELGWRYGEALALCLLGNLHRAHGEHDQARSALERSLALRQELGDRRATGVTLGGLGLLCAAHGDRARGEATLRDALALFERIEDYPARMGTLLNLGVVALDNGDRAQARLRLQQSLATIRNPVGLPRAIAWIHAMLAEIAQDEGDDRTAVSHRSAALEIFQAIGERDGLDHCTQLPDG
jgi:tetratricopeptide (TPR) repeat protein